MTVEFQRKLHGWKKCWFFLKKNYCIIVVLGCIVTFTKVLTMCHSWTHPLHHSLLPPFSPCFSLDKTTRQVNNKGRLLVARLCVIFEKKNQWKPKMQLLQSWGFTCRKRKEIGTFKVLCLGQESQESTRTWLRTVILAFPISQESLYVFDNSKSPCREHRKLPRRKPNAPSRCHCESRTYLVFTTALAPTWSSHRNKCNSASNCFGKWVIL
jgi:hypothetical protein